MMTSQQSWSVRMEHVRFRRRNKLNIPVVNTYSNQIIHCAKLYAKLINDHPPVSLPTSPFPRQRHRVQNEATTPIGHRSAPPWCGRHHDASRVTPVNFNESHHDASRLTHGTTGRDSVTTCTTNNGSRPSTRKASERIDPIKLSEYLKSRGLGAPVLVTSSHFQDNERTLPPGIQARTLSKNPSIREKVKGRARLDYEMANIKADAFCEQERGRYFRTASANFRNRDVRFQEEELREQMRREQAEQDDDDDVISIVASPLDREELFSRIETWIQDVEAALER